MEWFLGLDYNQSNLPKSFNLSKGVTSLNKGIQDFQ